jgi:putative ABC transport system permease protein
MQLWQDVRYGVRTLRKAPGFTLTAIATLALGIGATSANFSVCDAMLWKPLPLPNLSRLAMVLGRVPGEPNEWRGMAPADFADIGRQQAVFEGVAAWDDELSNLAGNGAAPERASRYMVTPNFFALLGAHPALGRGFAPKTTTRSGDAASPPIPPSLAAISASTTGITASSASCRTNSCFP